MVFKSKLAIESENGRDFQSCWGQQIDMVTHSPGIANDDIPEFYLIGELAQIAGINCGAIRFYERQGLLTPNRHGRMRIFERQDAERLRYILDLRKMGLPVKTIRKLLEAGQKVSQNFAIESLKATLEQHKAELLRQQNSISGQLKAVNEKLGASPEGG